MKTFYNEYHDDLELVHLGAQLPWKHNVSLIEKVKDKSIRKWYMERCIEEGWSKSILIYQFDTNLFKRQKKNIKHNNFNLTFKQNSDLVSNIMKDPYIFDFIELTDDYKEKVLENKMLEKLKNVLLEFGNGFSFIGNQYKITVGNKDFYIDLLFYHIKLKCYVAVELKMDEFIPEYGSKMNYYLSSLDDMLKTEYDNPSIGIILVRDKDKLNVNINKPIGVSSYELSEYLPKEVLESLPTEEELNLHIDMNE